MSSECHLPNAFHVERHLHAQCAECPHHRFQRDAFPAFKPAHLSPLHTHPFAQLGLGELLCLTRLSDGHANVVGMDGFVSKSSPLTDIPIAIDSVANGVPFYGRDIAILIRDITDAKLNNKNIAALSKREIEIIKACCDGLMGKEIAEKFHISLRAVNSHKTNLFNKLGLNSSVEMVRFAIEHGII